MGRLLRFLVRNWPLKLGAVVLATVLYAGLVLSQNARVWPGPVPIEPIRQPAGGFLLDRLPDVTAVRYVAPAETVGRIGAGDFRATVDLSGLTPRPGGPPVEVPVRVESLDPRVQVIGFDPPSVRVRLDTVVTRAVPVEVDGGSVPDGISVADPQLDATTVRARGPSSAVDRIARAVARVAIDPNAINVDTDADLIPVDQRGEPVAPVDLDPERVHVRIDVARQQRSRTVPVAPTFTGAPAPGFRPGAVSVTPPVVTVVGEEAGLRALASVTTERVDLTGRSEAVEATVRLVVPDGVQVLGEPQVTVSVPLEPVLASRAYRAGVTLEGFRRDRRYAPVLTDVLVTLSGRAADLDGLDPRRLVARLDVAALDIGRHPVEVAVDPPPGLSLVEVAPGEVDVVVSPVAPAPSPTASRRPVPVVLPV